MREAASDAEKGCMGGMGEEGIEPINSITFNSREKGQGKERGMDSDRKRDSGRFIIAQMF